MEEAPVVREEKGPVSVLTMVYRPYNLLGPKLINAIVDEIDAGARRRQPRDRAAQRACGISRPAPISTCSTSACEQGSGDAAVQTGDWTASSFSAIHGIAADPDRSPACTASASAAGSNWRCPATTSSRPASAKIGSVEATLGLHPLLGGIQRQVQRIGAMRAKEMSMLGAALRCADAGEMGPDQSRRCRKTRSRRRPWRSPRNWRTGRRSRMPRPRNSCISPSMRAWLAADEAMARVQEPIWASEDLQDRSGLVPQERPGLAKFAGR